VRIAVIGAGPTGLTAAHRLVMTGHDVDLFEASPQVGGLARSIHLWGRRIDLGSHVFATAQRDVLELWLRLLGDDVQWLSLRRGVFTGGGVVRYPLRAIDALRALPLTTSLRCGVGLARARVQRRRPALDAESWMVQRYGRSLFEQFFEQYAVKLWGVPCALIDASFAQFLLGEAQAGKESFPYPALGTGSVWKRMAGEFEEAGGRLHLETPIGRVQGGAGEVAVVTGDREHPVDRVVSSMPLPVLLRALPDVPPELTDAAKRLRMRSTVLVYLRLRCAERRPDHWLYVYPPEYRLGRVTFVDAWHPADSSLPGNDSIVCIEYWCDHGDTTWTLPDEAVATLAGGELVATGLLGRAATVVDAHVVRLRGTHPVPRVGVPEVLAAAQQLVATLPGVVSIGRHGQFAIPGVGACMESALETAAAIGVGASESGAGSITS